MCSLGERAFSTLVRSADQIPCRVESDRAILVDPVISDGEGVKAHQGKSLSGEAGGMKLTQGETGDDRIFTLTIDLLHQTRRHGGDQRIRRALHEI